ncbi:dynein heavy chain axonemal [Raphidocelis subcapitata]|uniref:Dynein heavy chain axonemal n=1 Tax=Raphidocelis subcapitata TaxID=307507 RepID=A0A2V0PMY3_9CHLO|nr:dynein heavy chain axonemal [Raphidocelis subcapitata]|eukprot:GBF98747.1 dynein heavy chain axonemal [Raphidocelis subcapitata]
MQLRRPKARFGGGLGAAAAPLERPPTLPGQLQHGCAFGAGPTPLHQARSGGVTPDTAPAVPPSPAAFHNGAPSPPPPADDAAFCADDAAGGENAHLLPRVMVPLVQPAGSVPRAVQIQRRRRLYASQDVRKLVLRAAADCAAGGGPDVTPAIAGRGGDQREQLPSPAAAMQGQPHTQQHLPTPSSAEGPFFDLEIFDDTTFESRRPRDWVPKAEGLARPPARVAVKDPRTGGTAWVPARVLDCEEAAETYLVELAGGGGGGAGGGGGVVVGSGGELPEAGDPAAAALQLRRWVPRVCVCFGAEDPAVYARRYVAAQAARARAEVNRILGLALNTPALRDRLMATGAHMNEANLAHARAMNKAAYDALALAQAAAMRAAAAAAASCSAAGAAAVAAEAGTADGGACQAAAAPLVPDDPGLNPAAPAELLPLELPAGVASSEQWHTAPGAPALIAVAAGYNRAAFADRFGELSFRTLLTQPEVIATLVRVRAECAKARKMCLFSCQTAKALRLEEFEQAQGAATDATANHLRDNWLAAIKHTVKTQFRDVGKGWYSLAEARQDTYEFSKLKRLLVRVRLQQQDTLRDLALSSTARLLEYTSASVAWDAAVRSTAVVDLGSPHAGSRRSAPLLAAEMTVSPDGLSLGYGTGPEAVHSRLMALFDNGLQRLQGLPDLEPQLMEHLFWPEPRKLTSLHPQEPEAVAARAALEEALARGLLPMRDYLNCWKRYEPLLALSVEAEVERLAARGAELTLGEVQASVARAVADLREMEAALPATMNLGLVQVNCVKVRDLLLRKQERLATALKSLTARMPREMLAAVGAKFADLERRLRTKATSIEEVDAQRRLVAELPAKMVPLLAEVEAAQPWYDALEGMRHLLADDEARDRLAGGSWAARLTRQAQRAVELLDVDQAKLTDEMGAAQGAFAEALEAMATAVTAAQTHCDMSKVDAIAAQVRSLDKQLRAADKEAAQFNSREAILGRPATDYSTTKRMLEDFEPFFQFWTTAGDWKASGSALGIQQASDASLFPNARYVLASEHRQAWLHGPLSALDPEAVDKGIAVIAKALNKLGKAFVLRGLDRMAANCEELKGQVEAFKEVAPLAAALRAPGMRPRHWEALSAKIGQPVSLEGGLTLAQAVERGLMAHLPAITAAAEVAGKEYAIEQALDKLAAEWEAAEVGVVAYRDSGTHVDEALVQQLDDHLVMLQSMGFSPHKRPFEERLAKWETQLRLVSDVLEQWISLQRAWMYLEPVFASKDIQQQLPLEAKRFAAVDRGWRKMMDATRRAPGACCSPKLLDSLTESNKLLETVQKGLADYLETKRLAFSRFFFLSNDELLQILSQARNPLAVQPHLRKCFEAIASLDFGPPPALQISAMTSAEGERVPFDKPMQPVGNVETWLGEVERRMRASVRAQIVAAMAAYDSRPRTQWVCDWPAMVVLAVAQVFWCGGVEAAIAAGGVRAYLEKCTADLMGLTDLVRGRLSEGQRQTLGALITIDVHARDVVQELADAGLQRASDFEWVSRLRYYWRDGDLCVDMVQASVPYGYEYLGNSPRLVITPLTDRCYMTLMSALHLNLGGAPAGPAGTGKTETTKDLAKALAKQCVVFNCSDGLDYIAMARVTAACCQLLRMPFASGKFFKGLASSGAWACFDEFNRIDLEVLSVIAQQILTIQLAIQAKLKRFIFEDTEIDLNPACAVFITMNPGYAGRSELPDNLKALFRPCAMMVPDYALIAEISLYSYGYKNAKPLARKMVATFKLCSEQLSSQDHYDYGMRAVKSVITAAGNLKREHPSEAEDVLVLRAIRDVNLPKFLAHDLPLFAGIVGDLFPGVAPPAAERDALLGALADAARSQGLQPADAFLSKAVQLFETTLVRHGLMLVGPTMAGKTAAYRSLARAMGALAAAGNGSFEKVRTWVLNPKAVTMGQLYGQFDDITHEWTDGVLACCMREAAQDTTPDKKWIMFDGPVDALWIENMNTVLDDNKKLCLVSGEIIAMTPAMTMMFEVEDLAVASPATVSRCGMVYMEPTALGIEPLLASWLATLPPPVAAHAGLLKDLFRAVVPGCLALVRKHLRETVPTVPHNLVGSLFRLVDALLEAAGYTAKAPGALPPTPEALETLPAALAPLFVFAATWSLGASCDRDGRPAFDSHLREALAALPAGAAAAPPEGLSLYEWTFEAGAGGRGWLPWMDALGGGNYTCDPDKRFSQIVVPTVDTVRYSFLLDTLLAGGHHALVVGETGTGKTLTVAAKLTGPAAPPELAPLLLTFSARTSAGMVQDIIDAKMDKRRKGVFGPPAGKRAVVFVDDLNMPQARARRERYFAQPPLELLRQWFDHGGQLVDTQFVAAMGPPGGGRNPMSDDTLQRIFGTILGAFCDRHLGPPLHGIVDQLVAATTSVYNAIRADLLPTPSKSHYTYNLRDVAKVVQGLMRANPRDTTEPRHLIALWLHESARVFEDRLTDDDRRWFRGQQERLLGSHFGTNWEDVVGPERLIYGDFLVPGAEPKVYARAAAPASLVPLFESYLEDYNANSTAPMRLVMFLDAIEHAARLCRIIRQPLGNALLLGVGGSGRKSLARLAAFIEDYEVVSIEVAKGYGATEWRDDLRRTLKLAGVGGRDTVFLLADTQIVEEGFLEDVNNILNSGDVPNLMGPDDQEEIAAAMRPLMAAAGVPATDRNSIHAFFVDRVRAYLHLVLAFSPVDANFRQRLRMFPSLVNCTTIDWFREWPAEALAGVARSFLADVDFGPPAAATAEPAAPPLAEGGSGGGGLEGVVSCCVAMHRSVEARSRRYYEELRRYNYVTPTSYLELLTTFLRLLGEKRTETTAQKRRLEAGLEKLTSTALQVESMQKELQELQPVLATTAEQVEAMMAQIASDKEEAASTRAQVQGQEREANDQAAAAKAMADDAQRELDAALPALDAAVASLKNLSRNDIVEVKSLQNPPAGVKLVMETACIMFDEKPKMKEDPTKMGKKVPDYWDASKKLLADPTRFLDSLLTYDKDNIPEATIRKVEPYIALEEFTPEAVSKVSRACTSICMWVRAMHLYNTVALSVAPKRAALAAAQATLDKTLADLKAAQDRLAAVEAKIVSLEAAFSEATARKVALAAQVEDCRVKLTRADKLIGGLGGERSRWQATVLKLQSDLSNLVGDITLSAGAIAYAGPFVPSYRAALNAEWAAALAAAGVPHSRGAGLSSTLADPVKVRTWAIAGLPTDAVSVENAIVISKARRWPLMIDPQGQANRWVRAMERDAGLEVVKPSAKDFLRSLENGVRFGRPVLLEDVGESLDPALEPLLLRLTYRSGGSEVLRLGDSVVPYHQDFRFYITTKLRNPHYAPEVTVKVSLLNFFVTPEGLEDQLLGVTVDKERPDLSSLKGQLVLSNARMRADLVAIEGRILELLSASQGNILDDEELIDTLAQAKLTSNEVSARMAEAEATERDIDAAREGYRPVAARAALLFFAASELAGVDPMYQYSLGWFRALFVRAMDETPKADNVEVRGAALNAAFTFSLYAVVCRSLFERHKLMFAFMLAIKVQQQRGGIDPREWRFLLAGPTGGSGGGSGAPPKPSSGWLTDRSWGEVVALSALPAFAGFDRHLANNEAAYQALFDSAKAHEMPLAEPFQSRLSTFQRLLVLRCLRPDKVLAAARLFVGGLLGERFVEPPPFDLATCFRESSPATPLVFVLSPGADPMADLLALADEMRFAKKFEKVSLGQGQGPKAERLLTAGMERGLWVCLQNCHLAVSWLPTLERIVEGIQPEKVHKDFRLWLTSAPSPAFPASILQDGIKMSLEPPAGLKANLLRQYGRFSEQYLAASSRPLEWRRLLFGLCLFHAVVQDRRKFGPLGWNIRYDFTDGDLSVSLAQVREYLEELDAQIPYRVLRFLATEINYGGRVTDDKDRRLINALVERFCGPQVLEEGYMFSPGGEYLTPPCETLKEFLGVIASYPLAPSPDIFGLHANADITCEQAESYAALATLLALQPRTTAAVGGLSQDEVVASTAEAILARLPVPFDLEAVAAAYPTSHAESMNTVLLQECIRYNGLLLAVSASLAQVVKGLRGLVAMGPELEAVVPEAWAAKAYPSLKPLAAWVDDLLARLAFIGDWAARGKPDVYWLSGFFFPQAFLTGTLQNFARRYGLPIETVSFEHAVMDAGPLSADGDSSGEGGWRPPEDGCFIRGLFLEGARWDSDAHALAESRPKELYTEMPVIWLRPRHNRQQAAVPPSYDCPLYKTVARAGTLSTTGHSTNYVTGIELAAGGASPMHWVERGVALFAALPF